MQRFVYAPHQIDEVRQFFRQIADAIEREERAVPGELDATPLPPALQATLDAGELLSLELPFSAPSLESAPDVGMTGDLAIALAAGDSSGAQAEATEMESDAVGRPQASDADLPAATRPDHDETGFWGDGAAATIAQETPGEMASAPDAGTRNPDDLDDAHDAGVMAAADDAESGIETDGFDTQVDTRASAQSAGFVEHGAAFEDAAFAGGFADMRVADDESIVLASETLTVTETPQTADEVAQALGALESIDTPATSDAAGSTDADAATWLFEMNRTEAAGEAHAGDAELAAALILDAALDEHVEVGADAQSDAPIFSTAVDEANTGAIEHAAEAAATAGQPADDDRILAALAAIDGDSGTAETDGSPVGFDDADETGSPSEPVLQAVAAEPGDAGVTAPEPAAAADLSMSAGDDSFVMPGSQDTVSTTESDDTPGPAIAAAPAAEAGPAPIGTKVSEPASPALPQGTAASSAEVLSASLRNLLVDEVRQSLAAVYAPQLQAERERREAVEQTMQRLHEQRENLELELRDATESLVVLKTELTRLDERNQALEADARNQVSELRSLRESRRLSDAQIQELRDAVAAERNRAEAAERRCEMLDVSLGASESDRLALQRDVDSLRIDLGRALEDRRASEEALNAREAELIGLRDELTTMSARMELLAEEHMKLGAELETLRKRESERAAAPPPAPLPVASTASAPEPSATPQPAPRRAPDFLAGIDSAVPAAKPRSAPAVTMPRVDPEVEKARLRTLAMAFEEVAVGQYLAAVPWDGQPTSGAMSIGAATGLAGSERDLGAFAVAAATAEAIRRSGGNDPI